MEIILNFLVDNYLWFLIISLILIFGLIGYVVDANEKKTPKLHFGEDEELSQKEEAEDESQEEILLNDSENDNTDVDDINQNIGINDILKNNEKNKENELPNE